MSQIIFYLTPSLKLSIVEYFALIQSFFYLVDTQSQGGFINLLHLTVTKKYPHHNNYGAARSQDFGRIVEFISQNYYINLLLLGVSVIAEGVHRDGGRGGGFLF